jgi:amino acid permease
MKFDSIILYFAQQVTLSIMCLLLIGLVLVQHDVEATWKKEKGKGEFQNFIEVVAIVTFILTKLNQGQTTVGENMAEVNTEEENMVELNTEEESMAEVNMEEEKKVVFFFLNNSVEYCVTN